MPKLRPTFALVILAAGMGGCATVKTTQPLHRTVLLTFDAASDAYVDDLQKNGDLDKAGFFAKSRDRGYVAQQLTPINIANTGPSHAAIFSGAAPSVSGIVGQNFATPANKLPEASDAFTYVSEAETIVAAARRQGKRTACFAAPGLDGRNPNYQCDYMLSFTQSSEESVVIQLWPAVAPNATGTDDIVLTAKDSKNALPPSIAKNGIRFLLTDRDVNDLAKYDTVSIQRADGTATAIPFGKIYPYQRMEDGSLVTNALWLNRLDPKTGEVDLYWGQPYKTVANDAVMNAIIKQLGAWPGTLDARGLHAGRISQAGFDALNEYQAQYTIDAMALLLKQPDWDLYIGYISYLDTVQHEYLLTSPQQIDYTAKSDRYAEKIKAAYLKLDQWMGAAVRNPDAAGTNFVVASDHGMVATHTVLAISSLIETLGYAVGGSRPDIGVYTSGASAHLYVNSTDRRGGHIDPKRKNAIIDDLRIRLSELRDPSGNVVFAMVQPNARLSTLELRHPENSGDLFVSISAGYGLDPRKSPTSRLFFPISYDREALSISGLTLPEIDFIAGGFFNQSSPGTHGHVANTPGIAAIFYALGPNIPKGVGPGAHMLQVTPSVACLLGISPPVTAKASAIEGFC